MASANTTRVSTAGMSSLSDGAMLAGIGIVGFITFGTWISGQLAGLMFKFTWPKVSFGQAVTVALAIPKHLADPRLAWPATARTQLPGPVGMYVAIALVIAAGIAAAIWCLRHRARGRRIRGFASRTDLDKTMSAKAVLARAKFLRPNLAGKPTLADVAVDLGRTIGSEMRLYGSLESSVLVLAAPRQGKTSQVIVPWLASFPGPALVTSVRYDVLEATAALRAGTPWVMELTGNLSWPHQVQWSPIVGCERFDTAIQRASVMIQVGKSNGNAGGGDSTDAGFFGLTATNLMAIWLHTAAITGRTMTDLLTWSSDDTNDESIKLLRDAHGARPGVLKMLDSFYRQPPSTRANLWATVQTGTASLYGEAAETVFCGPVSASFDVEAFVRSGADTIYLLIDERTVEKLAPLVSAFVDEIITTATRIARRAPNGRLDPPMGLILDEVTNAVPLPDLPKIKSFAAGFGIFITSVAQNLAAVEERWGRTGKNMLWANSTIKIALGGLAGPDLDDFSRLAGNYRETLITEQYGIQGTTRQASMVDRKTMTGEEIRTLDEKRREALVIHATTSAVKTRMTRFFDGRDKKKYAAATRHARQLMGRSDGSQ